MRILKFTLFCLLLSTVGLAQDPSSKEKIGHAIDLMDNGLIDEAINLLEDAKKNEAGKHHIFDYEIGYAYLMKKDYQNAISSFKKAIKFKDANDQCFQMLGNSYDFIGESGKALKTYDKGLKRFPNSGRLYLEKGVVYISQKEYNLAINMFDQGIMKDPMYPSNYYKAASLYLLSKDPGWGIIYGEYFMNIERGSDRTTDMSKWLYEAYQQNISFESDTAVSTTLAKEITVQLTVEDLEKAMKSDKAQEELLNRALNIPFLNSPYESTFALACVGQDSIDLASLSTIRNQFIEIYYANNHQEAYPLGLFEYQKKIIELGYGDAYNYWLLGNSDDAMLDIWLEDNHELWNEFLEWYTANPMEITPETTIDRNIFD